MSAAHTTIGATEYAQFAIGIAQIILPALANQSTAALKNSQRSASFCGASRATLRSASCGVMNLRGSMRCSCPRKRKKRMLRHAFFMCASCLVPPDCAGLIQRIGVSSGGMRLRLVSGEALRHLYAHQTISPETNGRANDNPAPYAESQFTMAHSVASSLRTTVYGAARAARSRVRVIDVCACRCA